MAKTELTYGWDHLHVLATDPEATAAWFGEALGAEIVQSPVRVEARFGPVRIFIDPQPEGVLPGPHGSPHEGLDHLALLTEDIDAAVADLKARGVTFTVELFTVRPGIRACFLEGPDGVIVEILERK